jgi:hypothetical protein
MDNLLHFKSHFEKFYVAIPQTGYTHRFTLLIVTVNTIFRVNILQNYKTKLTRVLSQISKAIYVQESLAFVCPLFSSLPCPILLHLVK